MTNSLHDHPLLHKALQFPPPGVRGDEPKPPAASRPRVAKARIGEMICFGVLELLFQAIWLFVKPIEAIAGSTYGYERVSVNF